MKKIFNLISWIVVAVILSIAVLLLLSTRNTALGIRVFSVLSGSMEPSIATGSLVITRTADEYQVGDVVTVKAERGKGTITHRIVEVLNQENSIEPWFQLKGDANEENDSEPIPHRRIIGKVVWQVPYLGRLVGFAQTQMGFIFLIVIPATLIAYNELMTIKKEVIKIWKNKKKKKSTKRQVVKADKQKNKKGYKGDKGNSKDVDLLHPSKRDEGQGKKKGKSKK